MKAKKYWTTLDQLEENKTYKKISEQEFMVKPEDDMEEGGSLVSNRRNFIKASGAAAVFMTAVGCVAEKKLVPYFDQPEELIPGNPIYYASIDENGESGLLVKTTEGRPIKLEGNPKHPVNIGKLDATGNAKIIDLYDPDRLREITVKAGDKYAATTKSSSDHEAEISQKLKEAGAGALYVTGPITSPAEKALLADMKKAFPGLKHIAIVDQAIEKTVLAQKQSYGKAVLPTYRYDKANVIVSLGYDFLSESANPLETSRLFADAKRLKNGKDMARVLTFEPFISMTGANSDERFRVKPSDVKAIAFALASEIATQTDYKLSGNAAKAIAAVSTADVESTANLKKDLIYKIAGELIKNKGESLIVAGGAGADLELLNVVNLINSMLDNDGVTVSYGAGAILNQEHTVDGTSQLLSLLKSGSVKTLLIQDVNLAYRLAAKTGVEELISKVPFKAGLFTHLNETANCLDVVLPVHHFLESWSDANSRTGLFSLGQPTIEPLWKTKAKQDYVLSIIGAGKASVSYRDYIKTVWQKSVYDAGILAASFDAFWESCLRLGVYDKSEKQRNEKAKARTFNVNVLAYSAQKDSKRTAVLYKTAAHNNGDSMNNPWLIEAPDPVSKICWDNYVSVSMKTAKIEGYRQGDILKLSSKAGSINIPVHIQPGVTDDVYAISLGWGRRAGGHVAAGEDGNGLGIDASQLIDVDGVCSGIDIEVEKTKETMTLACVQGHQYLENERIRFTGEGSRKILQETTLPEFLDPKDDSYKIKHHAPTDESLWRQKYPNAKHKWAMHIDTSTCTGCNACTISCQAENNIPVAGKGEVIINREMHWIRIDRYYTSNNQDQDGQYVENSDEVDVVNQPMLCQHCDNAPCETVCPVIATSHNEEGLNVQTYNRCVGTRYCSNNCPYKVRHYNWYDYTDYRAGLRGSANPFKRFIKSLTEDLKDKTEYPLMLQMNPDVTVRTRGVMEKCTFCIHRIRRWKTEEDSLGRPLPESAKMAACQQACPSNSITFGDILDENSSVSKAHKIEGNYSVLEELNPRPNVKYFTKLHNREPDATDASHNDHGSHH
jgi:MoCo/4Fe-4S cofactor protein with predicted Tat translocation signal